MKNNRALLSLVLLIAGFLIAFSYNKTTKDHAMTEGQYSKEYALRNELLEQQEKNKALQAELFEKQGKVRQLESDFSKEEKLFSNAAKEAEKYRMFLGKVAVTGQGVNVTLDDADYKPSVENINQYIVHDHHVFKVINELFTAGASAVAINGQRIHHDSYIICSGPVITVDGNQYPAPFTISAIGDSSVLEAALTLTGGVRDQLVNDNVVFMLEKKKELTFEPLLGET